MKTVILFAALVAVCAGAAAPPAFKPYKPYVVKAKPAVYTPVRYNVKASGEGGYVHDNTGSYSGQYDQDNSGAYVHDDNPYIHDDQGYKHQGGPSGSNGPAYSGKFPAYAKATSAPAVAVPTGLKQGNAAGLYDNRNYAIIRLIENNEQDGYHYLYETENGILAEEEGHLNNKGQKDEAIKAAGFFTYTGPDNIVYRVDYNADENGFVPNAAHLPVPPPIPDAIARSLEYQRSIGKL